MDLEISKNGKLVVKNNRSPIYFEDSEGRQIAVSSKEGRIKIRTYKNIEYCLSKEGVIIRVRGDSLCQRNSEPT